MQFDTYKEALRYWNLNKNKVPLGMVMGISIDGRTVRVSAVNNGFEVRRTKRQKPGSFSGFGSDGLGGVEGILNHADGKRYDSKSQYKRAVEAKGCRIVGNDWNNSQLKSSPEERGIRGDFNV